MKIKIVASKGTGIDTLIEKILSPADFKVADNSSVFAEFLGHTILSLSENSAVIAVWRTEK